MKLCIKGWIVVEVDAVDREAALAEKMITNIDTYGLFKVMTLVDQLIRKECQYKFEWAGASSDQEPILQQVVIGNQAFQFKLAAFTAKSSELDKTDIWYFNYQLGK